MFSLSTTLSRMFLMFSVRRSSFSSSRRLARSDEDDALNTPPEGRALDSREITHLWHTASRSPVRNEDKMTEIRLPWSPSLVTKLFNPLWILCKRIWMMNICKSSDLCTLYEIFIFIFTLVGAHGSPTRESQDEEEGGEERQRRHVTWWTASGQLSHLPGPGNWSGGNINCIA